MPEARRVTKKIATLVAPPMIALFALLLVWAMIKWLTGYPEYVLPSPQAVGTALIENRGEIGRSLWMTFLAAGGGLTLSVFIGGSIAILFSQSKWVRRGFFPLAIFLQTVPIVAIAPIVILWLDEGLLATIFVSFVVSLFPIITNTTSALLNVDDGLFDVFKLYRAGRLQTLLRLQIPGALPGFVTGLKISSGMSVLGAIVGEFFCATLQNKGLGRQIFELKDQTPMMYACVLVATLLGVTMFVVVSLLADRFLLYWDEKKIARL